MASTAAVTSEVNDLTTGAKEAVVPAQFELVAATFDESRHMDPGTLIEPMRELNPGIAAALALLFFGMSQFEVGLRCAIYPDQEDKVKSLFDSQCVGYEYVIGDGEAKRIVKRECSCGGSDRSCLMHTS
jgi:hypothetical protein